MDACRIERVKAEGMKHGMKLFDTEKDTRRAEFPEDRLIQSFLDRYPNVSEMTQGLVEGCLLGLLSLSDTKQTSFRMPRSSTRLKVLLRNKASSIFSRGLLLNSQSHAAWHTC